MPVNEVILPAVSALNDGYDVEVGGQKDLFEGAPGNVLLRASPMQTWENLRKITRLFNQFSVYLPIERSVYFVYTIGLGTY